MRFVTRRGNKLKFLGLTVYKERHKDGRITRYVLNVPVRRAPDEAWLIGREYERAKAENRFDMRELDARIAALAEKTCPKLPKIQNLKQKNIAFMATEIYDNGGHTKCLQNMLRAFSNDYAQTLFLTRKAKDTAALRDIQKICETFCVNTDLYSYGSELKKLYERILLFAPKVLFVFIHPNDTFGAMLLALLKKHTNIRILYSPHASHYPNLGMNFADLSLEGLPTTAYITRNLRHFDKVARIAPIDLPQEEIRSFSAEEIAEKRKEIGLKDGEKCTMSGAAAYKFFDGEGSEYFETVKALLENRTDVRHFVITELSEEQKAVVNRIFDGSAAKERLIFLPFEKNYELLFKCADVFIDSFPVFSAWTQVNLMALKVASVVKINKKNAHWSFHEYLPADYPYMFENAADMLQGIERLLDDEEERRKTVEKNYGHYLNTFEASVAKKRFIDIINASDSLECFYEKSDEAKSYRFEEMGY